MIKWRSPLIKKKAKSQRIYIELQNSNELKSETYHIFPRMKCRRISRKFGSYDSYGTTLKVFTTKVSVCSLYSGVHVKVRIDIELSSILFISNETTSRIVEFERYLYVHYNQIIHH